MTMYIVEVFSDADIHEETNIGQRIYLVNAQTPDEARHLVIKYVEKTALWDDVLAYNYDFATVAYLGTLVKESDGGRRRAYYQRAKPDHPQSPGSRSQDRRMRNAQG